MTVREMIAIAQEIKIREARVKDLTEGRDEMMERYGRAGRATMTYQDMLDDAMRDLAAYRAQFGL